MKQISGDNRLNFKEKILYLYLNLIRGIPALFTFINSKFWAVKNINYGKNSPYRHSVDSFLKIGLPQYLHKKNLKILDVGCGSGYIRNILAAQGYKGIYYGVDIQKDSKFELNENPSFDSIFIQKPVESYESEPEFDFVISQTSLEHIENEKRAIEVMGKVVVQSGVEIHIIPTFWSLFLYWWHGYRQYAPGHIKKLFPFRSKVLRIGGLFSFLLHFFAITIPVRFFRTDKIRQINLYPKFVKIAAKLDKYLPFFPGMYVIIIIHD